MHSFSVRHRTPLSIACQFTSRSAGTAEPLPIEHSPFQTGHL